MNYPKRITDAESFLERVNVGGPDDCWPYRFSANRIYIYVGYQGRMVLAHRMAWLLMRGPIPTGMTIDHLCFNTRCMNPSHYEVVPQSVNSSRARRRVWRRTKGWTATGDVAAAHRVLVEAAMTSTPTNIAKFLGLSESHVSDVIRSKRPISPELAGHVLANLPK
jgi:hypothetical protein